MKPVAWTTIFTLLATSGLAQSLRDQMFPDRDTCYVRSYTATHLVAHPAQRVTEMILLQDRSGAAEPFPGLRVRIALRGVPGGRYEAVAYCENNGAATLSCALEGDAGGFTVEPAKAGAVLVTVDSAGMGFENEDGFETLESDRGDDRSFLLQPARGCR